MAITDVESSLEHGSYIHDPALRPLNHERAFFIAKDVGCQVLQNEVVHEREHHYVYTEIDGFAHSGWYSPPAESDSGLMIVIKPGWGEIVDSGIGWELHRRMAEALPEAALLTHETDGIGNHADTMSLRQLVEHGIDQMSVQGLELLKQVAEDRRIVVAGTSMGSVIFNRLLNHNLDDNSPVDIAGVIYNAPALVDPSRVAQDMGIRFFPELIADVGLELVRTHPSYLGELLLTLIRSRPKAANLLPLAKQGIDLLHGTPDDEVERVLAHYPVDVVVGSRDPVGQPKKWHERAEARPELTTLHLLKGRGHGIAIKPYEQARKMSRVIREKYLGDPVH